MATSDNEKRDSRAFLQSDSELKALGWKDADITALRDRQMKGASKVVDPGEAPIDPLLAPPDAPKAKKTT